MLVLWRAWHLRDDVIHNKGKATVWDSVSFLKSYWECLSAPNLIANDAKGKQKMHEIQMQHTSHPRHAIRWAKPSGNHIKVNVDASFIPASGLAALGAIGRDSSGAVVFSAGCCFHGCTEAEEAEAQALLFGLTQAHRLALNNVIFESDCSAVVTAVNDCNTNRASWWACYVKVKEMFREFESCTVSKIYRECNVAAHELAAFARVNGDFCILADVPQGLMHVINSDCNPAYVF